MLSIDKDREAAENLAKKELKDKMTSLQQEYRDRLIEISSSNEIDVLHKHLYRNQAAQLLKNENKKVVNQFHEKLEVIRAEKNDEKLAVQTLFKSGNYRKGKLGDYAVVELYQPKSKRLKYDDDGRRQMLMFQRDAVNILIEDQIYAYFYGECR